MKKHGWYFLSVLLLTFFAGIVQADPAKLVKGDAKTLQRVDHNQHYLVIDDEIYYMPLNLKVYIRDRLSNRYRLLNRYALKAGQTVTLGVSGTPRKPYVDVVMISNDE